MAKEDFGELRKATVKETGVKVTAWDEDGSSLGNIDLADLKPGMQVRELGGIRTVADTLYEDDVDYMVPLDNNEYLSPLLIVTEPELTPIAKSALEIYEPVRDAIFKYLNHREDSVLSELFTACEVAYEEFERLGR